MSAEATEDETIADLAMRATHWRSEALCFAGQPEAVACLDYAEHIEVLAEVLRLEQLDDLAANGPRG
jgi:hypothetical protein